MERRYILLAIAIVVIILFLIGGSYSDNCASIGGCRSCWSSNAVVVESDLCTETGRCLAEPSAQQTNAISDVILCACEDAKIVSYADASLNRQIQDFVAFYTPYNITAGEICEQPGLFLAKTAYE